MAKESRSKRESKRKSSATSNTVNAPADTPELPNPPELASSLVRQHDFIVDTLFPKYEYHLIGGPSHVGKSMLLFHIMENLLQQLNVFGYTSHLVPFCYIACNQTMAACQQARKCSGIDPAITIPMVSTVGTATPQKKNFDAIYNLARQACPDVELIFLDGIMYICGNSGLDNAAVGEFLSGMIREMHERGVTIIATGRCAKPKDAHSTVRSIDRYLGATAWTEFAATFIAIEPKSPTNPRSDRRIVTVMPKRAPAFTLAYRFNSEGKLCEISEDNSADSPDRLDEIAVVIEARGPNQRVATAELLEIGRDLGILARSTMMNYINVLVRQGRLQDGGHGWYHTPNVH